jgi:two-component sensor histidine kinase
LVAGEFGLRFYAGVPLQTHDGYNLGTLCVIDKEVRPVSERQIADLRDLASLVMDQMEVRLSARRELERARRANEQANLLGREIEHRVANSLQFVSSILRLQSRQVPENVAGHFEMAAHRVGAVARVHRHLLDEENVAYVSALSYIARLSEDLAGILGVQVTVTGDEAQLTTSTIQSVGLLLNELVTNAAKHGSGKIAVTFAASKLDCKLSVCDEGKGLPPSFDFTAQKGLGMKIIDVLAKQLGGGVSIGSNEGRGTCFVVTFPRKNELAVAQ